MVLCSGWLWWTFDSRRRRAPGPYWLGVMGYQLRQGQAAGGLHKHHKLHGLDTWQDQITVTMFTSHTTDHIVDIDDNSTLLTDCNGRQHTRLDDKLSALDDCGRQVIRPAFVTTSLTVCDKWQTCYCKDSHCNHYINTTFLYFLFNIRYFF